MESLLSSDLLARIEETCKPDHFKFSNQKETARKVQVMSIHFFGIVMQSTQMNSTCIKTLEKSVSFWF
jgi:hypothetical protein